MRPHLTAVEEEVVVEGHSSAGVDVDFGHPSPDAIRIDLAVPRRVEAVSDIDSFAVAADFDHLRSAVERLLRRTRMRHASGNATEPDRAHSLRTERVGDVVLDELPGAPARHVQKTIVNREIDVGH